MLYSISLNGFRLLYFCLLYTLVSINSAYLFIKLQEKFLEDLLNSSSIPTEEVFQIYVTTVDSFIPDISPHELVEDLEELINEFIAEDDTLTLFANSSNVEVIWYACVPVCMYA